MKIERINENQIRCTLNKHDLLERHLKISELAYGSDKAKELFRDMMERANMDFGFQTEDIPLMIEAIPTSKESIVLVITKVDSPEELEEKFADLGIVTNKFIEDPIEYEEFFDDEFEDEFEDDYEGDLINCFEQLNEIIEHASEVDQTSSEFIPLHELLKKGKKATEKLSTKRNLPLSDFARLYSFSSLNFVVDASKAVYQIYSGKNSVWKDEVSSRYYLLLNRNENKSSFNKICSIINEFGRKETLTYATQDFFNEHYKLILKDDAITKLSLL
ncbi:MAG: adaptor protein MecA [Roseburia sp.]|nr:adaptor protein MecA [Roseburia sp.]